MRQEEPTLEMLRESPLDHLDWFTEWGGSAWTGIVRQAIRDCLGTQLDGQRVLELGPRRGRVSCLFALLGAHVVAADLNPSSIAVAQETARSLGVESRVRFVHSDGRPETLPETDFDIVFTKSVLVVTPDLVQTLNCLHSVTKAGGRCVFAENGLGGRFLRLMRYIKHFRKWDYSRARYFEKRNIDLINRYFDVRIVRHNRIPPIYLLAGTKRESVNPVPVLAP